MLDDIRTVASATGIAVAKKRGFYQECGDLFCSECAEKGIFGGYYTKLRSSCCDSKKHKDAVGDLEEFDLPLRYSGSDLQQAVCAAMMDIPFGDTCTYGEIAKSVGASAQAVGQACGGNAIPVIVPCHRVMGAGGKLVGYSGEGGVETKVKLLRHEGAAGFLI